MGSSFKMRYFILPYLLFAGIFCQAQGNPSTKIKAPANAILVYTGANYDGVASRIDINLSALDSYDGNKFPRLTAAWDNQISSIAMPDGIKVVCYKEPDFGGAYIEIVGNWSTSPHYPHWDNQISSIRILRNDAPVLNTKPIQNPPKPVPTSPGNNPQPEKKILEPLKPDQFYYIDNKAENELLLLNYSIPNKKFLLGTTGGFWKINAIKSGVWVLENNRYHWKDVSGMYKSKIELYLNGKFWALGASTEGVPELSESSEHDRFQDWIIEELDDGYYKIYNAALSLNNNERKFLFCNGSDKKLFFAAWDESKSLNGRWQLSAKGQILKGQGTNKFDNKKLVLKSFVTNQQMCPEFIFTSDATSDLLIIPCRNGNTATFTFQKTVNGSYFIKTDIVQFGKTKTYYFDHELKIKDNSEFDIINPDPNYTWDIIYTRDMAVKIRNTRSLLFFELTKGYTSNNARASGWGASRPDYIVLKKGESKSEQLWHLE